MATVTEAKQVATTTPTTDIEERKVRAVQIWAVVGVACLLAAAWMWGTWILSGDPSPTPSGPTPIPSSMAVIAHIWEAASALAAVGCAYWFLVRPWRRERRVTLDGLLLIAFLLLYWQDPLLDYFQPWWTMNTAFVNLGSWLGHFPGVVTPNAGRVVEPLIIGTSMYIYAWLGGTVLLNGLMRKAKTRYPRLSRLEVVLLCFVTTLLIDVVLECAAMRLGLFAYPGAIKGLTLFHGHYYQYPVYEAPMVAAYWTGFACLRYFRDDKGHTAAERGIDELQLAPRARTWLRFLALFGAVNAIFIVGYQLPSMYFGIHSDAWPQDLVKRSYLTSNLCGPGTEYACPAPGVPIPRRNSAHLAPDGRLIVPPSAKPYPPFNNK